ncbi:repressor LexA [candidate division WWE3 bacterium CG_4_9_14_0_2_um_filter_35_11]|uniref:LexA repressor n=1 Tax=candidate division WWE3 bacterium CG_4_9_14_0_2_um_filter_35_11 TaxID=1975077 RepID=A0A2M8EM49_UNCKA|nr:MAG: repressor LexA [candidate division WWE3 bacterium CG10_big_fil_rev_8_21_14_0_10_35_32]PJC23757.1 MAG: repressor LexA [candidate division WWE3 bacterium CG_4_9_14_0_2_um_filter_35_11]
MPVYLYPRQREIFEYIKQHIQKVGSSPTLKQIAGAMSLSSLATVSEHLDALEKKGLIERIFGEAKGIRILENTNAIYDPVESIEVPLVGYIAAGQPIEAIEDTTRTISIPADYVSKSKRTFVLQVVGDSMIDAHIIDGDQVICEQVNNVENGEIVVAIIDGEFATLKRFFKEATRVRLQPENSTMDPIYAENVEIKGRVIGVIRKY